MAKIPHEAEQKAAGGILPAGLEGSKGRGVGKEEGRGTPGRSRREQGPWGG